MINYVNNKDDNNRIKLYYLILTSLMTRLVFPVSIFLWKANFLNPLQLSIKQTFFYFVENIRQKNKAEHFHKILDQISILEKKSNG